MRSLYNSTKERQYYRRICRLNWLYNIHAAQNNIYLYEYNILFNHLILLSEILVTVSKKLYRSLLK